MTPLTKMSGRLNGVNCFVIQKAIYPLNRVLSYNGLMALRSMLNADVYSCFPLKANFAVPGSFPIYSIFVPLICTTCFLCYKEANDHNSASLLFLGTHPKLMLCMPLSLSGQLLLNSLL